MIHSIECFLCLCQYIKKNNIEKVLLMLQWLDMKRLKSDVCNNMPLLNSVPIDNGNRCNRSSQAISIVTTLACRMSDYI